MANYLNFDIYDLDLSEVRSNTELRLLLFSMPSRSILAIEDIDCSIKLENRENENDRNSGNNKVIVIIYYSCLCFTYKTGNKL